MNISGVIPVNNFIYTTVLPPSCLCLQFRTTISDDEKREKKNWSSKINPLMQMFRIRLFTLRRSFYLCSNFILQHNRRTKKKIWIDQVYDIIYFPLRFSFSLFIRIPNDNGVRAECWCFKICFAFVLFFVSKLFTFLFCWKVQISGKTFDSW